MSLSLRGIAFVRAARLLALIAVLAIATPLELSARGGRGGGGRMGGGGFSRGGIARSGGISRPSRSSPSSDRSARSRSTSRSDPRRSSSTRDGERRSSPDRNIWGDIGNDPSSRPSSPSASTRTGDSRSRDGSFETRTGETVDWESEVTRGEDGLERNTTWESTSGASGSGSSTARMENGQVQVDRTRHAESASGETIDRSWSAQREGDWIVREGDIKTSTGIDANTNTAIRKTDDGFVVHGAGSGRNGDYAGTIVKKGDDVYGRGVRVDGDEVSWGRVHCDSGRCTGGRVTADIDDYYDYPYYYYPYYYGWYSCPPGQIDSWHGAYGTPVYGCSNTVVISTTLSLGSSGSDSTSSAYTGASSNARSSSSSGLNSGSSVATASGSKSAASGVPSEARVTSQPVLMYELAPDLVVYSSDKKPQGVHAAKYGKRYFWAPGPTKADPRTDDWLRRASEMKAPTANASIITYGIGGQVVYLTSEKPSPGYFSETSDQLYAWMPGVLHPNDAQNDAIGTALAAHRAGGRQALDREARKLEQKRDPPPASAAKAPAPS